MADTATLAAPTVAQRVAAGVAWLDQRQPDWWQLIDLRHLDIHHSCRCILGQLYGDYYTVRIALEEAVALGFDSQGEGPRTYDGLWRDLEALQVEWTRVITERREAAQEVTGDGA